MGDCIVEVLWGVGFKIMKRLVKFGINIVY